MWLALLLLALLLIAVPWPPDWAERLYLGVTLPAYSAFSSRVVDAVRPSLSGLLAVALVTGHLLALGLGGRRALRTVARSLGAWGLALLLLFPFTFGLGYRLPSLAERQGLTAEAFPGRAASVPHLEERLIEILEGSAFLSRGDGPTDRGLMSDEAVTAASACVARLAHELRPGYPPARLPGRVKALPAGMMLRFGFAGVVSPWLLEPHVDAGLPPAGALAVALHEFAHTAGFASEREAEAVGLVAGLECGDLRVRYAAALRLASNIAAAQPPEARAAFLERWPERALWDRREAALAQRRFGGSPLAPGVTAAYDLYLRSQGDEAGMAAYGLGTELAMRLYLSRHGER